MLLIGNVAFLICSSYNLRDPSLIHCGARVLTQLYLSKGLGIGAKGLAPSPSSVMVGNFAMIFTIAS